MNTDDIIERAATLHDDLASDLAGFGGFLRCGTCRQRLGLSRDDIARYFAQGWPKCHDQTMTWWTRNRIDDGTAPSD